MQKYIFIVIIFLLLTNRIFGQSYQNEEDSLLKVLHSITDFTEKARAYNTLANYCLDFDNFKAASYSDSAIYYAEKGSDIRIKSDAFINKGNTFYYRGSVDSTLIYYRLSFDLLLNSKYKAQLGAAYNRMGLAYEAKSDYKQASQYLWKSVQIYEQLADKKGQADVYNNLGIIYDNLKDTAQALRLYENALTLYETLNELSGQANVLNNIASIFTMRKQYDTALQYFYRTKDILIKLNRINDLGLIYLNISHIHFETGSRDSAIFYINKAAGYYEKGENLNGLANVLSEKARIFNANGDAQNALKHLLHSLELRKKAGNLRAEQQTLFDLYETYSNLNDHKNALISYKNYIQIRDSIINTDTRLKISELELKYNMQKKDNEITLLTKDARLKKNFTVFLIIIIASLLTISILLYYFFRTKSKLLNQNTIIYENKHRLNELEIQKHKTEKTLLGTEVVKQQEINAIQTEAYRKELEHTKRELTTTAMHVLNKNKILAQIQISLEHIVSNPADNPAWKAEKIKHDIDKNMNLDSEWEQFKLHFDKVNVGFLRRLQDEFPELNKNDLKVCAYLRINLGTKEIAQMLNISNDGVNKRLYRLRKKINLPERESISKYILDY